MTMPSDQEQLFLELTNRLRADPAGEAARILDEARDDDGIENAIDFFGVDEALFVQQMAAFDPAAPLAWNGNLASSAGTHNDRMIAHDTQSHFLPGEPGLAERAAEGGYDGLRAFGENVYAYTDNPTHAHAGFVIDWGLGPGGMQSPAGHRNSLMNDVFTEIGIAFDAVPAANDIGPYTVTQHLGHRSEQEPTLLGVAIDDRDGDDVYDVGEGLGGITVTATGDAGTFETTTWASGGYQMALPAGTYAVSFTGGALGRDAVTARVTMDDGNVKLDAMRDEAGPADAGAARDAGPARVSTVAPDDGPALRLTGTASSDMLRGGTGDETLRGGAGDDRLDGGAGADHLSGGAGIDTASYESATRSVRVDLQNDAMMFGDAVGDTFSGIEIFRTGNTADQLRGDAEDNVFFTGGFSDRAYGRAGDDQLNGGAGADAIYGGRGADTMTGGEGDRTDRFIYFNVAETGVGHGDRDVITDFVPGQDRIEISRFDADETVGRNQAFDFVGHDAFSGDAGELRTNVQGGITVIQADTDGDRLADFEIQLQGRMTLTEDDFIL